MGMIVLGREISPDLIEAARAWCLGPHSREGFLFNDLCMVIHKHTAGDLSFFLLPDRIADRILAQMKKSGEIRFDRKLGLWVKTGERR
jgi:hypothetical protein